MKKALLFAFVFIIINTLIFNSMDTRIISKDANIKIVLPNKSVVNAAITDYSCFIKCYFTLTYPTELSVNTITYSQKYILNNLEFDLVEENLYVPVK